MNVLLKSNLKDLLKHLLSFSVLCFLLLNFSCEQKTNDIISIDDVENPPVHPNCTDLPKMQTKACFKVNITEFIITEFNSEVLVNNTPTSQKLYIAFIVDEKGVISNIEINTPFKEVKEEITRLLKNTPKVKPAMQNGKEVAVQYAFPLTFEIRA